MVIPLAISAFVLAACENTVTHETTGPGYNSKSSGPNSQFDDQVAGGSPEAYLGDRKATAHYAGGGVPTDNHAFGQIDTRPPDFDGVYAAAFWFPPGTLSGANPTQSGAIDIMRWTAGANGGGIRIGTDNRLHLVRSDTDVEAEKQFTVREGCWNWIAVHQKLKDVDGQALSEVFLNGERIIHSTKANADAAVSAVNNVRYGLVKIGSGQTQPLTIHLDNAHVSAVETEPPPAERDLCEPQPNVLFFVSDDQRADTVDMVMSKTQKWFRDGDPGAGITGGTHFEHAYTSMPLCCPARASIFTGQYPHNHTVTANGLALPAPGVPGLPHDRTLQKYLRDAGYRNAIFGKYLMGYVTGSQVYQFHDYGIFEDEYQDSTIRQRRYGSDTEYTGNISAIPRAVEDPEGAYPDCAPPPSALGPCLPTYTTSYVREKGKRFISRHEALEPGRPWFLYLAPFAPHETQIPNVTFRSGLDAWKDMTTPGSSHAGTPITEPVPEHLWEDDISDKPKHIRERVDACCTNTATAFGGQRRVFEKPDPSMPGRVFPGLREQQLRTLMDVDDLVEDVFQSMGGEEESNTLAFYIGDNGYMWREHSPGRNVWSEPLPPECSKENPNGSGQLTGAGFHDLDPGPEVRRCGGSGKGVPYRQAIQVPLLMRWPAHDELLPTADRHAASVVGNIDLAPTVMQAIGETERISSSEPMDGRSLLAGGGALSRPRFYSEWRSGAAGDWSSLVSLPDAAHVIAWYSTPQEGQNPDGSPIWQEWYDLGDVGERFNLYGSGGTYDPGEPPPVDISGLRQCKGTGPAQPNPCP